jgi:hypothetical protein
MYKLSNVILLLPRMSNDVDHDHDRGLLEVYKYHVQMFQKLPILSRAGTYEWS